MIMNTHPSRQVIDDELHACVDGRLSATARADLQQRLAQDPQARATLQDWMTQRDALRRLHTQLLDEPIPAALQASVRQTQLVRTSRQRWARWGGMAAGVVMAFSLGWFSNAQIGNSSGSRLAQQQPAHDFVRQAALAHAVYSPEVRHPVEVDAAQEEHLIQWLSKRLNRPLTLPRLHDAGFQLVGGRLLPGDTGARAQFMYQNAQGDRVTLYVGSSPVDAQVPGTDLEFRYSAQGSISSFYWIDRGFAYALSGHQTRQQLLQLARHVHQQL